MVENKMQLHEFANQYDHVSLWYIRYRVSILYFPELLALSYEDKDLQGFWFVQVESMSLFAYMRQFLEIFGT